jgi:hypothetical protein
MAGSETFRSFAMNQLSPRLGDRPVHPRVQTHLSARYTFGGKDEYPCTVTNVAPGGIAVIARQRGTAGQSVVVYIDQLGRVEGKVARIFREGFAVKLSVTTVATAKFARRINEVRAAGTLSQCVDRRSEPRSRPNFDMRARFNPSPDGQCTVIDISVSGALVATKARPPVGSLVEIGTLRGRVVRHSPRGVAIEFVDALDRTTLEDRFTEIALSEPTAAGSPELSPISSDQPPPEAA